MKNKEPFNKEEKEIMDHIVKAHELFIKLNSTHSNELSDWVNSIHKLQYIIGFRVLRRDYSKEFFNKNLK